MKFTDEQLTKIRESLSASGVPEDVVEFTISDITAEEGKGDGDEGNKQGDPTPDQGEEGNPVPPTDDNGNSDDPDVDEGNGEPAPVDDPAAEPVPPVPAEPVPPQEPELPPVPTPDPIAAPGPVGYDDSELRGLVNDLTSELEEQKKANEGLLARIDSLEEALKKGGYLSDDSVPAVGDETPKAPAQVEVDDPIDDVLRQLNSHKY